MNRVLGIEVVRSQVGTAAEPRLRFSSGQVAEVGVNGRLMRVPRMKNQRYPSGGEIEPLSRYLMSELRLELALNTRKVHPRFLENLTLRQDPSSSPPESAWVQGSSRKAVPSRRASASQI